MRSGFVGIIGRPNVGKSTLINSIIGKKVAITSNKPQTTRNIIQGIYNEDKYQIVFVDTPGIHKPNDKLGKNLNDQAYYSIDDTDIILLVVDAYEGLGKGDLFILERMKKTKKPVFLVINKIDKVDRQTIINRIIEYKDLYDFTEIIPVSSYTKDNIKDLIETLKKYLPDNIKYYGENDITNKSIDFLMAEIVREKIFNLTEEEVPHSITCITETVEVGKTSYNIRIAIIVDRDSLKKIIIGSKGNMIKEIGIAARHEIEQLLGKKVYLELFVKTVKKWREKEKYLQDYGFNDYKV
ncbi:MAG: GTPase Era [Bacilli bacterium]|nr:GTPase Era [Bacilli bacterium]